MIKIAHIQLFPMLSGVQRVSLDEMERLVGKGFEQTLICKEPGPLSLKADSLGVKCIFISSFVREISLSNDLKALYHLYKIFKAEKFDIVHSHSSKTGLLARAAAKLAGIKRIIHTIHGYGFPAAKSTMQRHLFIYMEKIGGWCSDFIICLHNSDKNIAMDLLHIAESKILVLPNGVSLDKYQKGHKGCSSSEILFDRFEDSTVIAMVGRLWEQKNPFKFVDSAIDILKEHKRNCIFLLIGDGELRESLESKVKAAGLTDCILFLGWRDDIAHILSFVDIFTLPSLWEGMPLAILEAQAMGLPCVVSNISGNKDLVNDGIDGFCFDLNKSLTVPLLKLIDSQDLRIEFGNKARLKVEENFDINKRIKRLIELYTQ